MSVRPVEFQLSIPKTFEASKEQQNTLRRPDMETMQNNISHNEELAKKMSSVTDLEKTEKKELKNDQDGNSEDTYEGKQKEKEDKSQKEEENFCFTPGKLDIKI